MKLIKGAELFALLILMPVLSGASMVTWKQKHKQYWCRVYVAGYLLSFALFEIITIPAIFLKVSFHALSVVYLILLLPFCALGVYRIILQRQSMKEAWIQSNKSISLYGTAALFLIAAETLVPAFYQHSDLDDSFFVATAETTRYTNTMFQYDAYTGLAYEALPARYVLAPFQIWNALVSWVSGITPAAVAHTVFPLVLIPCCFCVFYLLGCALFENNRKHQNLFLMFTALIFLFSFDSPYTVGTFALVRIWQGKAVLAAVVMPFLFLLCYQICVQNQDFTENWRMIPIAMFAGMMLSTMGVMLPIFVVAIFALYYGLLRRNWKLLFRSIACCMGNVVIAGLYLILKG